jgi:hypothetical protein
VSRRQQWQLILGVPSEAERAAKRGGRAGQLQWLKYIVGKGGWCALRREVLPRRDARVSCNSAAFGASPVLSPYVPQGGLPIQCCAENGGENDDKATIPKDG